MSIWFTTYSIDDLNEGRGLKKDHVNKHLGISFTEIGDDYLKGTMPVDERTVQPFGLLHGGVSCVLAESLGSVASWMCIDPEKYRAVGLQIDAHHLRPVFDGTITGICKHVKLGRKTHLWRIEMFNDEGKMNCVSNLTTMIIPVEDIQPA